MQRVEKIIQKNFKWIIGLITFILFIAIIRSVYKDDINAFDHFYYYHISKLISSHMTFAVKLITNFGSAFSLISLTLLILLIPKNKKYGVFVGLNLVLVFIFNLFLKIIFARPRPTDINLIKELGYSFPSAHAMISTAFYGFIIYLIWQMKISNVKKWFYSTLLSLLILLIGLTRIYLGVHFASDVFGGILIAISYLILYTSIISRYIKKNRSSNF